MKGILAIFLTMLLPSALLATQYEVRYAGFCFAGNYSYISLNYPRLFALSQTTPGGQNVLEKTFYDFFRANPDFYNFSLDFDHNSAATRSLAITVNRESVAMESFPDYTKLIYNLGFSLYVLDFSEMKVLQSYPVKTAFIELYNGVPGNSQIQSEILRLIEENVLPAISSRKEQIAIRSSSSLSMKVGQVMITPAAAAELGYYSDKLDAYSAILANQLTESFAFGLNVAMLPYAKDYTGTKMALSFSDATVLSFEIPPASYDLELRVDKFHKAPYEATSCEKADIYGAYINLRIYDADLGTEYWNQAVKWGAVKQYAAGQEVDDFDNYHEVLLKTISKELIDTIAKDKKLMENKKNKKGPITRCVNY